ncbi:MAG: hypothetical protein J0H06_12500, partial [Actinobacteria bacterium]|nr:hypothetical protein [Actinomycetota bacterium]
MPSAYTDPEAAAELPHHDLNREEALTLLEGVFAPELERPAGDFDELNVERFLSNYAAVVIPSDPSASQGLSGSGAQEDGRPAPALIESTVPLKVETPTGDSRALDLSLVQRDGQLESAAPLEPVVIPDELGEGVVFSESDIEIRMSGAAPERAPSVISDSVAAFPNVTDDTDLAVAATPTGVETLTALRSSTAPTTQVFEIRMPTGASLVSTHDGAEVISGGATILKNFRPSAIDADGSLVPVHMTVEGGRLTLVEEPQLDTVYPVLVDPLYQGWSWYNNQTSGFVGWAPWTNNGALIPGFGANWGPAYNGAYIEAQATYYGVNAEATWTHGVPRLAEEEAAGHYPTSYISKLSVFGISQISSPGLASPFLFSGIFDPATGKWAGSPGAETVWSNPGNAGWVTEANLFFTNPSDSDAKRAYMEAQAVSEAGWLASPRASYGAAVSVEVSDHDLPYIYSVSPPTGWINGETAAPIVVGAADTGLGVKSVSFGLPGGTKAVLNPCTGTEANPCPRTWTASLPASLYEPSKLPQGIDLVEVVGED